MTTRAWVVGAGGLLGSAVSRNLAAQDLEAFTGSRIRWGTTDASADLTAALGDFADPGVRSGATPWTIYWCAGASTTSGTAAAFAREEVVFARFLDELAGLPAAAQRNGVLFFASSAGAVYAGAMGAPFTETSVEAPLGAYGEAKLRHETLVTTLAERSGIRVAIGRIGNIYGPGQSLAKQQGLISRLCMATLNRVPLSIFVSIDTIRDYLYVDDCAELVTRFARFAHEGDVASATKILASGSAVTIGALIGVLGRVAGRKPLIVWGQSAESGLQSSDLRLRSIAFSGVDLPQPTNLSDGMARTLEDLRRRLASAQAR